MHRPQSTQMSNNGHPAGRKAVSDSQEPAASRAAVAAVVPSIRGLRTRHASLLHSVLLSHMRNGDYSAYRHRKHSVAKRQDVLSVIEDDTRAEVLSASLPEFA